MMALPIAPDVGVNVAKAGIITVNTSKLVTTPKGEVIVIAPVDALFGTVAVIWVSESTVNIALVPLNKTEVTPSIGLGVTVTKRVVPAKTDNGRFRMEQVKVCASGVLQVNGTAVEVPVAKNRTV